MKYIAYALVALGLLLPCMTAAGWFDDNSQPPVSASGASFGTAFSTIASVAPQVAQEIANAQKSVRLACRKFGSKSAAQALLDAARAGRDVKIIVDKGRNSDGYSAVGLLQTMGHPPHVLTGYDDLYLNYIVIDEKEIILGSFATLPVEDEKKNPVGILIIHNAPELAKSYLANFDTLWANSAELKAK